MSRGPGAWQAELLRTTAGIHTTTIRSVVRARLPDPGRDAYAACRRGAKGLVLQGRISACYAFACRRCGAIQDAEAPRPCCDAVGPLLAVARPGRQLSHPAPAPATAPPWVSVPAAQRFAPGLATPTAHDLASLATRNVYEALSAGTAAVNLRDLVALLKLSREIEQDARRPDPRWQASLAEVLRTARHYLGDDWPRFAADLRSNELLLGLWPRPGPGP